MGTELGLGLMRIRSTKPEFWRSERVASVCWEDRLVLKGLESYVDDNGVGKDDLSLIVADVFPRDLSRNPPGTLQKVSEALHRLSEAGLLWRYEADRTSFIYISFWESIQRIEKPTRGRFPRPDGTLNYRDSEIRESSRNVPGALRPGTGEQGNRGTGEKNICAPADADDAREPDGFEAFWDAYGKKVGRKAAVAKYRLALRKPGITETTLLADAKKYIAHMRSTGAHPQYTKDPARWLNGEHWNDDLGANTKPDTRVVGARIETPPDGLTNTELAAWHAARRTA